MVKNNAKYESTRNKNIELSPSEAVLQGLCSDGGLFVIRDLKDLSVDINKLIGKDYFEIVQEVLGVFLDFTDEEIKECAYNAYEGKFSSRKIAPLVKLKDSYILELFNGPTSAFKDFGLLMLPQLMSKTLSKTDIKEDILILTATSGDTGKAALDGFSDVPRIKILVFYPYGEVSKVQEMQMITQEGKNLEVVAIHGNFDDAQSGVKNLFGDNNFRELTKKENLQLSSANSINIGRLAAQVVYYFAGYMQLIENKEIPMGEMVNFVVPTGNFGNILAGYYAKILGLPINRLVCASNSNNILHDFISTGVYDKKREFLETISPSMDILISSNLERLLYYVSEGDNHYVSKLMSDLKENGIYKVENSILDKIKEIFLSGYAGDDDTKKTIKKIYEKDGYLLDTHTAVAYKVMLDLLEGDREKLGNYKNIILSTASPYKFSKDVFESFDYKEGLEDEFLIMKKLYDKTKVKIPQNLEKLNEKKKLHNDIIKKENMKDYVLKALKWLK